MLKREREGKRLNFLHKLIPSDLQRIFKSRVICESRYFPFVWSLHESHSERRSRKSCNNGTKFPQNLTLGSQNLPHLAAQTCGLLDLLDTLPCVASCNCILFQKTRTWPRHTWYLSFDRQKLWLNLSQYNMHNIAGGHFPHQNEMFSFNRKCLHTAFAFAGPQCTLASNKFGGTSLMYGGLVSKISVADGRTRSLEPPF